MFMENRNEKLTIEVRDNGRNKIIFLEGVGETEVSPQDIVNWGHTICNKNGLTSFVLDIDDWGWKSILLNCNLMCFGDFKITSHFEYKGEIICHTNLPWSLIEPLLKV